MVLYIFNVLIVAAVLLHRRSYYKLQRHEWKGEKAWELLEDMSHSVANRPAVASMIIYFVMWFVILSAGALKALRGFEDMFQTQEKVKDAVSMISTLLTAYYLILLNAWAKQIGVDLVSNTRPGVVEEYFQKWERKCGFWCC